VTDNREWPFVAFVAAMFLFFGLLIYSVHSQNLAEQESFKKCLDKYAPAECAAALK
jgi:hypothetical protein